MVTTLHWNTLRLLPLSGPCNVVVIPLFADIPVQFTLVSVCMYVCRTLGTCQCRSRGDINHTFQELCISPMVGSLSLSSCRCYTEQCSVSGPHY